MHLLRTSHMSAEQVQYASMVSYAQVMRVSTWYDATTSSLWSTSTMLPAAFGMSMENAGALLFFFNFFANCHPNH